MGGQEQIRIREKDKKRRGLTFGCNSDMLLANQNGAPMKSRKEAKDTGAACTQAARTAAREVNAGRLMRGNLVTMRRTCGKKTCRCARGELHESLYVSQSAGGRTRMAYVPAECVETVRAWIRRYQRVRARIEQLSEQAWRALARRDV